MNKKLARYFFQCFLYLSATITAILLSLTAAVEATPVARTLAEAGISTQPITPQLDAVSPPFSVNPETAATEINPEAVAPRPINHFPHPLTAEDIEVVEINTAATPSDFQSAFNTSPSPLVTPDWEIYDTDFPVDIPATPQTAASVDNLEISATSVEVSPTPETLALETPASVDNLEISATSVEISPTSETLTPQTAVSVDNFEISATSVETSPTPETLTPKTTTAPPTASAVKVVETASTSPTNLFPYPLLAQEVDTEETETTETETTAEIATESLSPRFGGQFTTGPEAGYNSSYGSVYGWLPLAQNPGNSVTFAEGRFNIATKGGRLGGNLLLGYRNHIEARNLVWGAYLGYDIRSDNSKTYHQLNTGADIQTGIWETRINGYFPIADTTNTIAESSTILSSTTTNPQFVGNFLQFTQTNTVRRESIVDSALTGFDLETGAKLYAWEGGDLRGYLGTYVYGGENVSTFVGFRSRLVVRPNRSTNIGLSLQTDGEFGTNLILSVGATFGGSRRNDNPITESVLTRLGESVQRQSQIALARRTNNTTSTTTNTTNATNPATGQPWFFRHVSKEGNSNGTFESPYTTIAEALNGIPTDGNQIVYVQGSSTFAGNLNIPSNVQLLSTGPTQQINTTSGNLTLPLSGSGNTPTINGQVIANADSVFNGFNVTGGLNIDGLNGTRTLRNLTINVANANESGISCSDISGNAALNLENVTINVSGVNSNGVRCTNVAGNVTINGGTITKNNNQFAVLLQNVAGSVALTGMNITSNNGGLLQGNTINNLSITNSTLVSNNAPGNGIDLENVTGTATITANTGSRITGATTEGISLRNSTGTIDISGFEITNPGQNAVRVSNVSGRFTLSNGTVTTSGNQAAISLQNNTGSTSLSGMTVTANNGSLLQGNAINNLSITNSTLVSSNAPGNGIDLENVSGTATITANTGSRISGATNEGISLRNSTGTIDISGFEIADSGQNGVRATSMTGTLNVSNNTINNSPARAFFLVNTAGNLNLTLANNQISNSVADGIRIDLNNTANVTATVSGNTIDRTTDAAGDAIDFEAIGNSVLNLTISDNRISNSGNSGIELEVQDTGTLNSTITGNTISNSGGDGILFLHNSSQDLRMIVSGNTITNSGTTATGITTNAGVPVGNEGNGGFGIGVLTLANGNLRLDASSNTITDSQDAKIGIAANPESLLPGANGSSRIDADFQFNTLSGSGRGASKTPLINLDRGSLGALADNNGTVCVRLQNNTANEQNGAAYLFANTNPGVDPAVNSFFIQDTANTGNTGTVVLTPDPVAFTTAPCNLP
ncbi:MAG: right-handed parallel beta-helix repeat-containing protein [Spirulinaceae cyanobacterium]